MGNCFLPSRKTLRSYEPDAEEFHIVTNIAEGCARDTILGMHKALTLSMGSASKFKYQLLLSRDLGYLSPKAFESLSTAAMEEKRMLASFIVAVNRRANGADH